MTIDTTTPMTDRCRRMLEARANGDPTYPHGIGQRLAPIERRRPDGRDDRR